jgi:hypothetical protein
LPRRRHASGHQANDTVSGLTYGGPAVSPPLGLLAALALLGCAVLAGRGRPRAWGVRADPVRRTFPLIMVGAVGFVAALVAAQFALGPGVVYYLKKGIYALLAIEMILLGGSARRRAKRSRRR